MQNIFTKDGKVFEIKEGQNGSGKNVFVVQVSVENRGCIGQDVFDNRAEAENWVRWA